MKWKYKVVIKDNNYHLRKALDKLGEKGWEAFSVIRIDNAQGNVDPSVFEEKLLSREVYIAYLKRPKDEPCKRVP